MSEMKNLDIRDFATVASVDDADHVVLSLFSGKSGKMKVGMFRTSVVKGAAPSISPEGYWVVGDVNTEVMAEGKTPELRKGADGIEFKYTSEEDDRWRMLVPFSDLRLRFEELTPQQIDEIRLKYEDLTELQIKELQKPSLDMVSVLEQTNESVTESELLRESAEEQRRSAETLRGQFFEKSVAAESEREVSEKKRVEAEQERSVSEEERRQSESERVEAEAWRKEDYEMIRSSLVTDSRILVIPESEYEAGVDSGTIDETKLYFAFED